MNQMIHWRHASLGFQACGEMYSRDSITDKAATVTCPPCATIVTSREAIQRAHGEALEADAILDDTCADCQQRISDPTEHCTECGDHMDGEGVCQHCGAKA